MKCCLFFLIVILSNTTTVLLSQLHTIVTVPDTVFLSTNNEIEFNSIVQGNNRKLYACGRYYRFGLVDTVNHKYYKQDSDTSFASVYVSNDNGRTWSVMFSTVFANNRQFSRYINILSIGDSTFFVTARLSSSNGSHIISSSNLGQAWKYIGKELLRDSATMSSPRCDFLGSRYIVITEPFSPVLYVSSDTGATWVQRRLQHPVKDSIYDYSNIIVWADSLTLYAANYASAPQYETSRATRFYRSTDGGVRWQTLGCTVEGFIEDSSNIVKFEFIKFVTPQVGYAYGAIRPAGQWTPTVFKTTNGGTTWTVSHTVTNKTQYIKHLQTFGPDSAVIVTINGIVFSTTDGGTTWRNTQKDTLYTDVRIDPWSTRKQFVSVTGAVFQSVNEGIAVSGTPATQYYPVEKPRLIRYSQDTTTTVEEPSPHSTLNNNNVMTVGFLAAYPLPASSAVSLNIWADPGVPGTELVFYDMFGMQYTKTADLMRQITKGWFVANVDIGDMPNGVYVGILRNARHTQTFKILVTR